MRWAFNWDIYQVAQAHHLQVHFLWPLYGSRKIGTPYSQNSGLSFFNEPFTDNTLLHLVFAILVSLKAGSLHFW